MHSLLGNAFTLTNCALSRTGLAAVVICAGWARTTCGVGEGAFVVDIDE